MGRRWRAPCLNPDYAHSSRIQAYAWERGTNFAVEVNRRAAEMM